MGGSGRFLYADTYEKERCGRDISCGKLSVLCLIVVLPAVLCCLFFAILMISTKTKEVTTETTAELVTWMKSLDLDLSNGTKLSLLNPVDLIVRCSLDLGVSAVFEFELKDKIFYNRKRRVEFSVSVQEKFWMHHRRSFKEHYNLRYYAQLLRWFSPRNEWYHDISTAYAIIDYEYEFYAINQVKDFVFATYIPIGDLYKNTTPYITKEQWVTAFSKYTNNTYTETDSIFVKDNDLQILALSLKSKWLGAKGLNYLVAWNVYTRLVNFTLPYEIGQFLKPSEVCYDHTGKAMRLALLSPYLEREASPSAVEEVKKMLSIIRNAFSREFETSSWVVGEDRRIAISKLANLRAFVGSPGQRIAPYFVERLYCEYSFLYSFFAFELPNNFCRSMPLIW
ncbi:hypothetical protein MRX96_048246 [Rhipicephalus microplus]